MPKTDHWRPKDGSLPYTLTSEAFDRMKTGGEVTKAQFDALNAEVKKLEGRPVAANQVTKAEFDGLGGRVTKVEKVLKDNQLTDGG